MMTDDTKEQEIRERAYALWEQAGSPEGQEEAFWNSAEKALNEEKGHVDIDKASEESFPASDAVNHM